MLKRIYSLLIVVSMLMSMVTTVNAAEVNDPFNGKKEINIVFIGGSITEGAGSSEHWSDADCDYANRDGTIRNTTCYAGLVGQYFIDRFPDKKVNVYNSGVSGTGSAYARYRLEKDVIQYNPDMVFVEFAINDRYDAEGSKRTMEGVVRELLKLENPPIINFIYTTDANSAAVDEAQEEIAQHYGIPSHNIQQHIDKMLEQGRMKTFYEISGDGTHPNDKGYKIYADFIINNLKKNSYFVKPTMPEKPYTSVKEFTALRFIEAKVSKRTGAWIPETKFGKSAYTSVQVGATMTIEFYGPTFALERACSADSNMKFSYSVDGGPEKKASTYGAKMATTGVSGLKNEKHTITLKVLDAGDNTGISVTGYYVDDYDNPDKDAVIEEEEIHVDTSMREIYVSPDGDDANEGTIDKPLKTLQQATRAASAIAKDATSDIKVIIREGTYDVGDGWIHTKDNSGTANANINYVAFGGEKVRVVNSVVLDNDKFKLVTDEKTLKRIPKMAHGKVYEMDLLAEGIEDFGVIARAGMQFQNTPGSRMLLVNNRRYDLARWPNEDYATINKVYANSGGHVFGYSGNKDHWATAKEAWVAGYYTWLWADDALPVKSVDTANKKIYTGATHAYGVKDGNPYFIYNLLEELDVPSEWFLDSTTGRLYFYPVEDDLEKAEIRLVTKQTELLSLKDVSYVSFKNINFEGTSGTAIKGTGLSHVTVDGCNVSNADNKGIHFNGKYTTIQNCYVKDTGKGGISAGTGAGNALRDGETLDSNHNVVRNNHTERFSLASRTYSTGITVGDRQALVSHNTINNANHRALGYTGTENIIEYNDIYNVLKYANDMGAMYVGRTWVNPGNIIRYNYIHHSTGRDLRTDDIWYTQGIYFDDMYAGATVYGNTFESLNRGVFLHAGKYITVEKNVFKECAIGIDIHNFSSRSTEQIAKQGKNIVDTYYATGEYHPDLQQDLIPIHKEYLKNKAVYDAKFPWLDTIINEYVLAPYANTVKDNIFIGGQAFKFDENAWKTATMSGNYELDESYSYDEAKQFTGYTDIPSEKEAGIIVDEKKQIGEFRALFPENNSTDQVADEIILSWEDADGANQYRLIVAEDEKFEKVIYDNIIEENFKVFTRLKYNRTKYFWKVYGNSAGNAFTDDWIENSNGVMCFRTAAKETLNNIDFDNVVEKSEAALNNASLVEGEEPGMHKVGSKQVLREALNVAREGIKAPGANSPFISDQYKIDYETSRLDRQYTIYTQSINSTTVDIKEILSKSSGWGGKAGGYSVTSGSAVFSKQAGPYGYTGERLENYKKLKMKLAVDPGNSYACIGIRASNTTVVPWQAKMYIFLVKDKTLELQKFGSGSMLYEAENKYFHDGALREVEFGATDTPDGTQITVTVDGETVFDVLDSKNPILDTGYFYVYLADPMAKVTIKPAN